MAVLKRQKTLSMGYNQVWFWEGGINSVGLDLLYYVFYFATRQSYYKSRMNLNGIFSFDVVLVIRIEDRFMVVDWENCAIKHFGFWYLIFSRFYLINWSLEKWSCCFHGTNFSGVFLVFLLKKWCCV